VESEDEFAYIDPSLAEQAYANISDQLLNLASLDEPDLGLVKQEILERIGHISPGYMAFISRHEETIQMISQIPSLEHERPRYNLIQMNLGFIAAGLFLAEYYRLEAEQG
jgi:hypothetical protein